MERHSKLRWRVKSLTAKLLSNSAFKDWTKAFYITRLFEGPSTTQKQEKADKH